MLNKIKKYCLCLSGCILCLIVFINKNYLPSLLKDLSVLLFGLSLFIFFGAIAYDIIHAVFHAGIERGEIVTGVVSKVLPGSNGSHRVVVTIDGNEYISDSSPTIPLDSIGSYVDVQIHPVFARIGNVKLETLRKN